MWSLAALVGVQHSDGDEVGLLFSLLLRCIWIIMFISWHHILSVILTRSWAMVWWDDLECLSVRFARAVAIDSGEERMQEAQVGSLQISHSCLEKESQVSTLTFSTYLWPLSKLRFSHFYKKCFLEWKTNPETNYVNCKINQCEFDLIIWIK